MSRFALCLAGFVTRRRFFRFLSWALVNLYLGFKLSPPFDDWRVRYARLVSRLFVP